MTGDQSFAAMTVEDFLLRLASALPTPGGGSASAIAGAMAASLLSMVASLCEGRPKYDPYTPTIARALDIGDDSRVRLLAMADDDARAYDALAAALRLPRETEAEIEARQAAMRQAALRATEIPLEVLRICRMVAAELESLAGRSNLNASSDLVVGALLVDAAARGAAANVIVNLPSVGDQAFEDRTLLETTEALALIEDLAAEVRQIVGRGKLREPEDA